MRDSLRPLYVFLSQEKDILIPTYDAMRDKVVIFATDSEIQMDFYALQDTQENHSISFAIPFLDEKKEMGRIFIFQNMKEKYFAHKVSSKTFYPILRPSFKGQWISEGEEIDFHGEKIRGLRPLSVFEGTKEDVLKRTSARVYTIVDAKKDEFRHLLKELEAERKEKSKNFSGDKSGEIKQLMGWLDDPTQALRAVNLLVKRGFLKWENEAYFNERNNSHQRRIISHVPSMEYSH